MSSAVFELDSSACSICPFYRKAVEDSENDKHSFLVGTAGIVGDNKIYVLEYEEESNSLSSLWSWSHSDKIKYLSSSSWKEGCLFAAIFNSSYEVYQVTGEQRDTIFTVHKSCHQILWDAEDRDKFFVVSSKKISSVALEGSGGDSISEREICSDDIVYASIDPFHSTNCLCVDGKKISVIDFRAPEPVLSMSPMHGFGLITTIEHSSVTPGRFLTTGTDGVIKVYDIRMNSGYSLDCMYHFQAHDHSIHKALFNPFHDELLISCSSDQSLRLWELKQRAEHSPIQSVNEFHDTVLDLCWSDNGPWVFAGVSYNGKVIVDTVLNEKKMAILLEENV